MEFENAKYWINELNQNRYAGYHDWRLPTLEEAMRLVEPVKNIDKVNINSVFDEKQRNIWTTDANMVPHMGGSVAWVVRFRGGGCDRGVMNYDSYVRAVRS